MPKLSDIKNIAKDKSGVLPMKEFEGILAVHFEDLRDISTPRTSQSVPVRLSNGHTLWIHAIAGPRLLAQVRLTHPDAFFNTAQEAFSFIKENNLPIAVERTAKIAEDAVFWNYRLAEKVR